MLHTFNPQAPIKINTPKKGLYHIFPAGGSSYADGRVLLKLQKPNDSARSLSVIRRENFPDMDAFIQEVQTKLNLGYVIVNARLNEELIRELGVSGYIEALLSNNNPLGTTSSSSTEQIHS